FTPRIPAMSFLLALSKLAQPSFRSSAALLATLGFFLSASGRAATDPINLVLNSPGGTPGQIIIHPHVYIVFWNLPAANDPMGERLDIIRFLSNLGGTRWNGPTGEYQGMGFDQSGRPVGSVPNNDVGLYKGS